MTEVPKEVSEYMAELGRKSAAKKSKAHFQMMQQKSLASKRRKKLEAEGKKG
jgi:hypothetical protein